MKRNRCIVDDAGIFIGFTSLPISQETDFYKREIKGLFNVYKKGLKENFPKNKRTEYFHEFRKYFYKPKGYYIFGQFDLAVISLVDHFEFSTRTFHPFDPLMADIKNAGKRNPRTFSHKILLGPSPMFERVLNIVERSKDSFLSNDPFPLIAINQLKLSNAFIITYGTDFLRCAIRSIRYVLESTIAKNKKNGKKPWMKFIIIESYSWHEITLLLFMNAYEKIAQFLLEITEMTFGKMVDLLRASGAEEELKLFEEKSPLISKIIEREVQEGKLNPDEKNARANHVFTNSITTLGFDFEIFNEIKNRKASKPLFCSIKEKDKITPYCRWFIKSGHIKDAVKIINGKDNITEQIQLCMGRGDFIYPLDQEKNTKEFIEFLVSTRIKDSTRRHVLSVYTTAAIEASIKNISEAQKEHHYYFDEVIKEKMLFEMEKTQELQKSFNIQGVPKITAARVLNMISIYNQGIDDPLLYSIFLELSPFIDNVFSTVKYAEENYQINIHEILDEVANSFNRAYRNRFHLSYLTSEITDFNLEFKGGIQQLVTAYDGLYKAVSSVLGNPKSIACIAGNPSISTLEWALNLNFFHIFQPEFLGATVFHEAANHFLIYKHHLDPPDFVKFTSLSHNAQNSLDNALMENGAFEKIRSDYESFIRFINPAFFDHVFSDIITYYFAYTADPTLFCFWYWNYFATLSYSYIEPGKLNETQFLDFLLRQLSVLKFCDPSYFNKYNIDCIKKIGLDKLLDNAEELFEKSKGFINDLFGNGEFKWWFNEVTEFVKKEFFKVYENVLTVHYPAYSKRLDTIRDNIIEKAEKIVDHLKVGGVLKYRRFNELSAFQYSQALLFAYLKLLKDEWGEGKTILQRRNSDGKPDLNSEIPYAKLLFDPRGGTFVYDPDVRREYFKYRCALTMSLWDMAMKEKESQILKILYPHHTP